MKNAYPLLALILSAALPATASARPRVVGDLSDGALLGEISSTAQLQNDFQTQAPLLARATDRLGLSAADFEAVRHAIARGQARYVEIPRHLDGMAGEHDGRVFAVHNVEIPSHTYGWEVDLAQSSGLLVYLPNRCGNISYLDVRAPDTVARVALPVTTPVSAPFCAPSAVPLAQAPVPQPTAAPIPTLALAPNATAAPAAAPHHFSLLPVLALAFMPLLFHSGSGSTGGLAPTPIHTICPTAAIWAP
jgi:hypothetical protein